MDWIWSFESKLEQIEFGKSSQTILYAWQAMRLPGIQVPKITKFCSLLCCAKHKRNSLNISFLHF